MGVVRSGLLLLAAWALLAHGVAAAQGLGAQRVRVSLGPDDEWRVGTVVREGPDSLILSGGRGFARARIWAAQQSVGSSGARAARLGASIGAVLGAGYAVYTVATSRCDGAACYLLGLTTPLLIGTGILGGAAAGFGVGWVVGQVFPAEQWRPVAGYGLAVRVGVALAWRRAGPAGPSPTERQSGAATWR
ncbi:MAG: hypothetical protein R2909_12245 [Gemmatimonadales bacterium]